MAISLSFSAAQKYILSPYSWYAHYLLRLRPKAISSPLVFGSALDEGLNVLLAVPLDRSPAALEKAKETFLASWTHTNHNGEKVDLSKPGAVTFSKTEIKESVDNVENKSKDVDRTWEWLRVKGLTILEAYAEQVVPKLEEVYAVQVKVDLKNERGDAFVGIIDLVAKINGKVYILDNKSASSKYAEDSVRTSPQLSTYFDAVKDQFKANAAGYIVYQKKLRTKKQPFVQIDIILDEISEELIEKTYTEYDTVLSGIKAGQFECSGNCKKAFWGCSYQKWCESGHTDMTGLEFVKDSKK